MHVATPEWRHIPFTQEMTVEQSSTPEQHKDRSVADSAGSATAQQSQEEQRIQTEERLSMDPTDMADAIDHEKDQKFDGDDESRYEDEVEEALPDNAR